MADEARTMDYVRQHGYPVPAVEEISHDGIPATRTSAAGPQHVVDRAERNMAGGRGR